MRKQRIVLSLAIAISCGIVAQKPASAQEYRGTFEQQIACTPDVMRLCGDQIPDVNRIVACLRQNTELLGDSCRAVFESSASMPQQPAPRPPKQLAPRARTAQPVQPKSHNDDDQ
jgi:hypothetical protein